MSARWPTFGFKLTKFSEWSLGRFQLLQLPLLSVMTFNSNPIQELNNWFQLNRPSLPIDNNTESDSEDKEVQTDTEQQEDGNKDQIEEETKSEEKEELNEDEKENEEEKGEEYESDVDDDNDSVNWETGYRKKSLGRDK